MGDTGAVLLMVVLALAARVGAALFSAIGTTNVFSTRNLAASWPGLALALACAHRRGRPAAPRSGRRAGPGGVRDRAG